ncbi:hypothetical protein QBC32DRAFT_382175 [Pseudoneurospora amorphoporcata]|uniref:Uncharacterized protein n=1 Tax=Pseudoneurospora amorphoporcata TaxID=241081 RepID=A0AAN6NNF2_9PEZI|nr:hypothetical protein QBC32DRAFT_382175 [Pseudoneurospora amorphoporcata]
MFTPALKYLVQVVLTGTFLISLLNPSAFVLAAPSPSPAVDPASTISRANVPLSPEDALAEYTAHGPMNRREAREAEGLNLTVASKDGPPKWTGGNNEVIHFFNCQKRPNWGHGTDSLIVICEDDKNCRDLNYLPPDDSLCLMDRFEDDGIFHIWEGGPQGCMFVNYNNELSWNITKDAQKQADYTTVGFLTSDTYVYQGYKDDKHKGLAVPFHDCQSMYYFTLRKDLQLVHGG